MRLGQEGTIRSKPGEIASAEKTALDPIPLALAHGGLGTDIDTLHLGVARTDTFWELDGPERDTSGFHAPRPTLEASSGCQRGEGLAGGRGLTLAWRGSCEAG